MRSRNSLVVSIIVGLCLLFVVYEIYKRSRLDVSPTYKFELLSHPKTIKDSEKKTLKPNDINHIRLESKAHEFQKGFLKFDNRKVAIFVHGSEDMISSSILNYGDWETEWMNQFVKYIKENEKIQVLDIGCNLGVYTLIAASLGSNVYAVDANKNNTDRLAQSVMQNDLQSRVSIFMNAVSDERKLFSMQSVPSNIGGQAIIEDKTKSYQVKSILLDDLIPFVNTKQDAMMKIDIEGHEIKALKGAENLFDVVNIKLVLMEWFQVKVSPNSPFLMKFFLSRNYKAFQNLSSTQRLDPTRYKDWPYDVIWRKF